MKSEGNKTMHDTDDKRNHSTKTTQHFTLYQRTVFKTSKFKAFVEDKKGELLI